MDRYELTFLTRSEEETAGVTDAIISGGGQIETQLTPIRRRLSYPISGEPAAVYHTVVFTTTAANIAELNAKLSRNDRILRHLIIAGGIRKAAEETHSLKEKDLEVPESLTKGMAELAQLATTPAKTEEVQVKDEASQPTTEEATALPQTPTKVEATVEELTAEERQKKLDEKLKSILGDE